MLLDTLRADWAARGTSARVSAPPEFADGALTLGAGTKLAEARGERRDEAAESERAVALVSVAIGRPLDPSAATHVRRALTKAREGDAPLALIHLALAGAGRLDDPREDARRLFIADGLMKAGIAPRTILEALGAAPKPADLDRAYNPDQPARARRQRAGERAMDEQGFRGRSWRRSLGPSVRRPSGGFLFDAGPRSQVRRFVDVGGALCARAAFSGCSRF